MLKEIKLQDLNLPGSRLDLFLVFVVGVLILRGLGFDHLEVWLTGAFGCGALFLTWALASFAPQKIKGRLFLMLWWAGIVMLLAAKVILIFTPDPQD